MKGADVVATLLETGVHEGPGMEKPAAGAGCLMWERKIAKCVQF